LIKAGGKPKLNIWGENGSEKLRAFISEFI
jgi:hypothetical protein